MEEIAFLELDKSNNILIVHKVGDPEYIREYSHALAQVMLAFQVNSEFYNIKLSDLGFTKSSIIEASQSQLKNALQKYQKES